MNLTEWARRWNLPDQAIAELQQLFIEPNTGTSDSALTSEAGAQSAIRLEASQAGMWLMRNNVGAYQDQTGRWVRYGLANESRQMNKIVKSSDLIGIDPVLITSEMVGFTIGQFVAREVKKPSWRFTGNEHELAQLKFLHRIAALGGNACFANGVGTL